MSALENVDDNVSKHSIEGKNVEKNLLEFKNNKLYLNKKFYFVTLRCMPLWMQHNYELRLKIFTLTRNNYCTSKVYSVINIILNSGINFSRMQLLLWASQ